MKKINPLNNLIVLAFLLIFLSVSCRKDIILNNQQYTRQNQQSLKSAFSKSGYQSELLIKLKDSIDITWHPNWSLQTEKVINDSLTYYYVPLDLKMHNSKTKKQLDAVVSNTDKYLLFKQTNNDLEIKLATYIIPTRQENNSNKAQKDERNGFIQNHTTNFKKFNGILILKDFKSKTMHSY